MLSIGEFSELTGLSVKTLRYYHAQGLLVPAQVDEETQFRRYTVEQVERAGQIDSLRRAGLPVARVRELVDNVDLVPAALRRHAEELRRRREEEDRALAEASAAVTGDPSVRVRQVEAVTVLSTLVPHTAADTVESLRADAAEALARLERVVAEHGWSRNGTWWRSPQPLGSGLAALRVSVPVVVDDTPIPALPEGVHLREEAAGPMAFVSVPKPERFGSLTTAISRLCRADLGGMTVEWDLRQWEHDTEIEYGIRLRPLPSAASDTAPDTAPDTGSA